MTNQDSSSIESGSGSHSDSGTQYTDTTQDSSSSSSDEEAGGIPEGETSTFSTIMNVVNNTLGVGLVTLPNKIVNTGVGVGVSLIAFSTILSAYSFWMIGNNCGQTKTGSYKDLMVKTYKKKCCGTITSFMLAVLVGLVLIIYSIIVGIFFKEGLNTLGYCQTSEDTAKILTTIVPYILASAIIFIPLSFCKSLHAIRHVSWVAVAFILAQLLLVIFRCGWVKTSALPVCTYYTQDHLTNSVLGKNDPAWKPETPKDGKPNMAGCGFMSIKELDVTALVASTSAIGVASNCHFSVPGFYTNLEDKRSFGMVACASFGVVGAILSSMALSGYFAFAGQPSWNKKGFEGFKDKEGNLKKTYEELSYNEKTGIDFGQPPSFITFAFMRGCYEDPDAAGISEQWQFWAMITQLGFALSVVFTIPMVFNVFRFAFLDILGDLCGLSEAKKHKKGFNNTTCRRYIITTFLLLFILVIALFIALQPNGIPWVCLCLDVVQIVSGNPIMFIFPALSYLKINEKRWTLHHMGAYVLLLYATICCLMGSYDVIWNQLPGLLK